MKTRRMEATLSVLGLCDRADRHEGRQAMTNAACAPLPTLASISAPRVRETCDLDEMAGAGALVARSSSPVLAGRDLEQIEGEVLVGSAAGSS